MLFGSLDNNTLNDRASGGHDAINDFSFANGDRISAGGRIWIVMDGEFGVLIRFSSGDTVDVLWTDAGTVSKDGFV